MAARLLTLGVFLTLIGCAHVEPPTPESMQIDDFKIEGEKQLKESDIKEKIVTNESSWLPSWFPIWGRVEWFDPITWQADLRRIQRFYEANGYYQARVLEESVTEHKPRRVKLLVKLREGAPARVNTVDL
ncbi:MAG TPA: POTRA domain-containing protein, partial [Archangium sp.]